MIKQETLLSAVNMYIELKRRWTLCKGEHFRQVCNNCIQYPVCKLYEDYFESWIQLQEAANEYERENV
jgi:hypothetical protein